MLYEAKKECLQVLKSLEKQGHIDLCYSDESGFSLTLVTTYVWQYNGQQIQILLQKSNRVNVFALLRKGKQVVPFSKEGTLNADFL